MRSSAAGATEPLQAADGGGRQAASIKKIFENSCIGNGYITIFDYLCRQKGKSTGVASTSAMGLRP